MKFLRLLAAIWLLLDVGAFAAGDSVVVINEIHYNPAGGNGDLEYVELHNQLSLNVDMSGWRFDGGITYAFPEGTVIPARGYLVVAKKPSALQAATGYSAALGPFTGSLSNDGEGLKLWNNNAALRTRPATGSSAPPVELWSGDLQGDGAGGAFGQVPPTPMSGVEANSGFGNIWNILTIPGHAGSIANPSFPALKNSTGAVTGVGFSITGTVTGFSNTPANGLTYDYLFVNAGVASTSITWQFSGLDSAKSYSLWLYGSHLRTMQFKVDRNGNGLADESAVVASAGGVLVSGLTPNASGVIMGSADGNGTEGNWGGFQLFIPGGTAPTIDLGAYNESLEKRRLMSEIEYADDGDWPVGADGSGFTLARIDPQSGGPSAKNWTVSAQLNGTPGAVNFPSGVNLPTVAWNEIAGASAGVFEAEIFNYGTAALTLTNWQIVEGDTGVSYTFPDTNIAPGTYLTLSESTLGFRPLNNARLFLFTPARARIVDAVKVANSARARSIPGTGRWLRPSASTFGTANAFNLSTSIVINEIFYHPYDEGLEQWIELKNRSAAPVDLTGWKFTTGIDFTFPPGTTLGAGELLVLTDRAAALRAKYPGRNILGDYDGSLAGGGELVTLEDAAENPADEVAYEDSGRWSPYADGGGASLELKDADADNSAPEAWAPSSMLAAGSWQTVTYTMQATDDGIGNDAFKDFIVAMLDAGEVLLDDVSVRESPTGANTEFIQNGSFQTDALGANPSKWRCIGNHGAHGRTVVVTDPDVPSNKCLRLVATGPTEDKHNRIETTFMGGRQITVGNTYKVTFRARWMAGSNQVNTRAYFNFLQKTSLLTVGSQWGTPGLPNSAAVANIGPTGSLLTHLPTVPAANGAVSVSVTLSDPDNITAAQLYYRVGSGAWSNVAMTAGALGRYTGTIPGRTAGSLVQFYISATDGLGAAATYPGAGAKSGAFYRVNDSTADTSGLRGNFRVLMSPESETLLLTQTNRMSNDNVPATILEDERIVYYDVGVRLKGSAYGRFQGTEFGYNIDFLPEQRFRGIHDSISIERASSMRDVVAKHMYNRAGGGYWSQYDDINKIIGPGGANGPGGIASSRTSSVFLEGLFPDEPTGTVFNHELLYQPNGTVDGQAESLKANNPYNHTRGSYDLADRGADKEVYRFGWQIRSQRKADNYTSLVRLNRAWARTGTAYTDEIDATIDVDQWMRTWAMMGLVGVADQYGRVWEHNWRMYQRPTDGRLIALPWDLDGGLAIGVNDSLPPNNGTITKLFGVTAYKRAFDSHVLDLVNTTFNTTYMTPWINHFATVTGEGGEFGGFSSYISGRSAYALSTLPASVPFSITTNGGNDFTTAAGTTVLNGTGWMDVYTITPVGQTSPLAVTWLTSTTWRATIALTSGVNAITLKAHDQHGTLTGADSINITSSTTNLPASASNIVISEIHYHPADPSPAELAAGYDDADLFQYVELHNISALPVELAGAAFTQGLTYDFTQSAVLPPGGVRVLARNLAAFQARYGVTPGGVFTGRLSHSDETITLLSATSATIQTFRYEDQDPWPVSADQDGYSLQLIRPKTNPNPALPINWTSSAAVGGSPGVVEDLTYTAWITQFGSLAQNAPLDDPDLDGLPNVIEYGLRSNPTVPSAGITPTASVETLTVNSVANQYFVFHFRRHIGATSALYMPMATPNLQTTYTTGLELLGSVNNGDGTETVSYRSSVPVTTSEFGKLRVTLDP